MTGRSAALRGAQGRERLGAIGMVDHRGHDHKAGGAGLGGPLRQTAGLARAGFGDSQQRRLALGCLLHGLEDVDPLVVREHRALSERPAGDQPVAARVHLDRKAALHFLEVERAVLIELGRDRRQDPLPHVVNPLTKAGAGS
jgi:hypothetical protein